MPILDFKELSTSKASSVAGEDLEGLVRELGKRLGLEPDWAGRGADQGRDLFFVERRKGPIGSYELRWLVSCKDFSNSGRSVTEGDVGSVSDKLAQHAAKGFLLATTTTASAGLKAMLDGIRDRGELETLVWDRHELESLLLQGQHLDLVERHLPLSYAAYTRPKSLPQVLSSLEALIPPSVHGRVREILATYQVEGTWLTGDRIWPHDRESAATIDAAVTALLESGEPVQAARAFIDGEIEFDAFEAALTTLESFRPDETRALCQELVRAGEMDGFSLHAYRFYVERYGADNGDQIELAVNLAADDLQHLFGEEVGSFIDDEITSNASSYRGWDKLDALSSHTTVDEAYVEEVDFRADREMGIIRFKAKLSVSVTLEYDRTVSEPGSSFPGTVEGSVTADGISLDDFDVDTDRFYE